MTKTVRDTFLADHDRLRASLERLLAATGDANEMARLWNEFESRLLTHLGAEEHNLISALLSTRERDARVLLQEHRHLRARLGELSTAFRTRTARLDSVRDFIDELRAHAQTEDRLLYQWADARLDEASRTSAIEALAISATE